MITIGSLFSGIGGFELGLERAIPNSRTIWQCEQDSFCRSILAKHWPGIKIYEDITKMDTAEVQSPDILCGGFPCQDISTAGKGAGIHGKKSGLWWHMAALISRIRPPIIVLENVPAVTFRGGREVLGSLAELGYDAEWTIISARQFGAPHLRKRWFCVAYSSSYRRMEHKRLEKEIQQSRERRVQREESSKSSMSESTHSSSPYAAHSHSTRCKKQSMYPKCMGKKSRFECRSGKAGRTDQRHYWKRFTSPSPLCGVDDGISKRVDRIRALGNAIVPQCSEYIGHCIVQSGLLEELRR
jgi:DNA (cytosine-5)-methyltransferase 1